MATLGYFDAKSTWLPNPGNIQQYPSGPGSAKDGTPAQCICGICNEDIKNHALECGHQYCGSCRTAWAPRKLRRFPTFSAPTTQQVFTCRKCRFSCTERPLRLNRVTTSPKQLLLKSLSPLFKVFYVTQPHLSSPALYARRFFPH